MTPEVRGLFQGSVGPQPQPSRPADGEATRDSLLIDCDRCSMRGVGCDDCVVSVLLGGPPLDIPFDESEQQAIDVLADAGLVPPLRMVESRTARPGHQDA
jgi:hypothetical protein